MEVDTGAAVSVISEETYKELFMNLSLKKASVQNIYRGKNTCPRRNRGGSDLPRAESSVFPDGSKRQGSQFVWQRFANAIPTRLENNWPGDIRKSECQGRCPS